MAAGFSTRDVAPGERRDYWREMVRRHFVPLRVEPLTAGAFDGSVRLLSIGELDVAEIRGQPMLVTRTTRHIERSGSEEYFVALHLRGIARGEQDGRVAALRPGDLALFDSARPYRIAFHGAGSFAHAILRIPREVLDARVDGLARATALTVKAGSRGGRLATPALTTLMSEGAGAAFVDPVLDLLIAALNETAGLTVSPASARQRTLAQIKRFTLSHLASDELSPDLVARACYCSPRHLHRLFEQEGTTFRTFVREARLRQIARDLSDPAMTTQSIAQIGRRHGYSRPPVLTRAFTERYGTGPRAFRHAAKSEA